MHLWQNIFWKFGTLKLCIQPQNTIWHDFLCRRFAKCSETLPNIILDRIGQIGCVRGKSFSGSSIPQNSAFRSKTQVLQQFSCRRSAKCSETLPNIVLGPIGQIGCVCGKTFFESSISRTSAFIAKNKILHDFSCWKFAECSETLPNIIFGLVGQIGCNRAKKFSGSLVPRNSACKPGTQVL